MRNLVIFIFSFIGIINLYSQEEKVVKVSSIEEATNKSLLKTRELFKNREDKIIISYEYIYNIEDLELGKNDFVKIYDYDMNKYKKGDFVYILKVLISFNKDLYVKTLLFKCTKKSKKNIELTHMQNDSVMYQISR